MLKKKSCILILVLLLALPLFAQRESANWYFGFGAGLDFNSGIPEVLSDGQIATTEGCSTISDNSGNLLFYTEGVDVWDKNHNIMQNGDNLLGDNSSSQSTIVVPNVSNSNIYYLFTADVFQSYLNGSNGNGFNYSIIDISLNGGLGSVINKNINLLPQSSEKVSAVNSLDGSGFWVVTHAQNKFYAYKVDGGGVNPPVVSTIGINIDSYDNIRGAIKLSPNGEMLAITHSIFDPSYNGFLSLFDFNLSTGVVSNEREIGTDRVFYGVEFSPDSSKLFASAMLVDDSGPTSQTTDIVLYQYDLNFEAIDRTEFIINTYESDTDNHLSGALQLGFDKKVYHSILESHLSVIYQPNLSRRSADFREFSVSLGSSTARYGLPSYEQSAFESIINVENLCFNNPTEFNIIIDEPIQTISWDFGDPASGINNTSTNINPTHIFTSTGRFAVTINVDYVNRASKTYIDFIEIGEAPALPAQVELTQCDVDADDGITKFNLAEAESSFGLSSDDLVVTYFETLADALENENTLNELGYVNTSNGQLIYAKVFVNTDCYSIIEVILNVEPMSNLGEYSTIFVCQENPDENLVFSAPDILVLLENDFTNANISIYYSESDALLEINNLTGNITISNNQELKLYFRVETINDCDFIGSIFFSGVSAPIVEDKTAVFCSSKTNILDAGDEFWSYLWSTGETTREIEINGPGNYWVEVSTGINCSDIVNFEVQLSEELEIVNIEVDDFRPQNSVRILLDDYSGAIEYSLDGLTFSNSNYFNNVTPGIYNVHVKKDDCHLIEQTILVGGYPNYFTPNGDGINDTWKIKQPQYFQEAIINVFDRYGKLLIVMQANDGWDGKHEGNILTPSDYWFSIELNNKVVFGHFTLKL